MNADEIRQFDTIVARFAPRRRDDLRPGAAACVGHVGVWTAMWIIEPGEGDDAGQWAMSHEGTGRWPFLWAPLGDLEIVGGDDEGVVRGNRE